MRLTYRVYSATRGVQKVKTKTAIVITAIGLVVGGGGGLAMTMLGTAGAAPATTITQANPQGWAFFDDNGQGGSGAFVNGPSSPPLGTGSAELDINGSTQGYALGGTSSGGTKLADLTAVSYSTFVQQGNDTIAPALQFNVDSDVTDTNNAYQGRLVYEPYLNGTVTDGQWQSWDALSGKWWLSHSASQFSNNCGQASPCTFSELEGFYPNIGILNGTGNVVFKAGSGWNVQFQGNVDAFTIGVSGNETTYNFDEQNCFNVSTSRGDFTAAQIGGNVTGDLDAHGCDIGVYYNHSHPGNVKNATVHDANQYGVFVDGNAGNVSVDVTKSHIDKIGNHTNGVFDLSGVQNGVGIFYNSLVLATGQPTSGKVQGEISDSQVDSYQKGGIVTNGTKTKVDIDNNVVTGAGPTGLTAQNGVQVSRGATGDITDNTVAANAYVKPSNGGDNSTAAGVLVYGGWGSPLSQGVTVENNKLVDNDVAVSFAEYNAGATGPAETPTKNVARDNWVFSAAVTNVAGLPALNDTVGYQAGIQDVGNRDSACDNTILGPGYVDQGSYDYSSNMVTPGPDHAVVRDIDAGYTFPTTDFSTCHGGHGDNHHFNDRYFDQYRNRHKHWWF